MLEINLENRKFKFYLKFYGKLNFIFGDSGGHKSYLAEVALNYLDGLHRTKGSFKIDGKEIGQDRILVFDNKNNLSGLQDDNIAKHILEEYEKQKLEGLFDMMDKIHENSKKLNEQIKHDKRNEKLKIEEYEKTFIFGV